MVVHCLLDTVSATRRPKNTIGKTDIIGKYLQIDASTGVEIEFYGGIPYAEPPLGQLRLQLPVISTTFRKGVLDAGNFGPGCLQTPNPSPPSGVSEDCLSLNIYRPVQPGSNLPVLVWIYGGAFNVGASSFYNASSLVARSVIRDTPMLVVSINYRVGPLGFPQGQEAARNNILNLGLHDQIAALEWIQVNIEKFGGDKTKVTVAGESAGATCIALHMLKSKITTLARSVILESLPYVPVYSPDKHENNWQTFVSAIPPCANTSGSNDTLSCLRSIESSSPFEQALITTQIGFANISFQPVIDGPGGIIVDRPSQIIPKGNLPTLIGSNLDEGTIIVPQSINSVSEIEEAINTLADPLIVTSEQSGEIIKSVLGLYPDIPALGSPFGTGNTTFGLSSQYKRMAAIFGDLLFQSGRRVYSRQISASGFPVFAYHFTDHDAVPFPEFEPASAPPQSLGVPHTSELPFVFGNLINKTPKAMQLSTMMQDYWISFVTGLNPNDKHGMERLQWAKYTPTNPALIKLDGNDVSILSDTYRLKQISLWLDNPDFLHR